jgi:hypothetical protein
LTFSIPFKASEAAQAERRESDGGVTAAAGFSSGVVPDPVGTAGAFKSESIKKPIVPPHGEEEQGACQRRWVRVVYKLSVFFCFLGRWWEAGELKLYLLAISHIIITYIKLLKIK